jgi:hypothetical protein
MKPTHSVNASEAKQSRTGGGSGLDCFVALLLAMTADVDAPVTGEGPPL